MEDDADNNRRSYTPADVRELSDALASRRCAEVRPHPKFTVDGNAETRVLLANEQRALEVCSLSYLAEGLPLPDAVRLVGLGQFVSVFPEASMNPSHRQPRRTGSVDL